MKIGIDARMLGKGFGLARYIEQLILHLGKIDRENEYIIFLRKDNFESIQILEPSKWEIGNRKLEIHESDTIYLPSNFRKVLADYPWYGVSEQLLFPFRILKEKVDLMHFPHWNVPLLCPQKFVVTVHDLTMFHFPRPEATTRGRFLFWFKDRVHRIVLRLALRRAKHVFVTCEFTKNDVQKYFRVKDEKMSVVLQAPFGKNNEQRAKNKEQETRKKEILKKYGIEKPFILYVGAAYPHKNLLGLAKAWKIFEKKYGLEYQLVFAGKRNYFYDQILGSETIGELHHFRYLDFVPDDDLVSLYEHCSLYVFPSLYEGFGLPPLEAQSGGAVVASSHSSCLPEILADSAVYFDPENYDQMADVIFVALTDSDMRSELRRNSKENLKRFSWEELAWKSKGVYEKMR